MKKIDIPGLGELILDNLVLDYNGTLAIDGKLIGGVDKKLQKLSEELDIYVLTADTFGTAESECEKLDIKLNTFNSDDASIYKRKFVESLGEKNSICIGNGYNDIEMFKAAGVSICTVQAEGACGKLFMYSDVVVSSILDGLDIIIDSNKLKATLRG